LLFLVAFAILFGRDIPVWLQPSTVGLLWGGLVVCGFSIGGIQRGHWMGSLIAGLCSWLMGECLQSVTDLAAADCLLLSVLLLSGGWLAARLDLRRFHNLNPSEGWYQWTIADLVFITTMAACLCQAWLHLQAPPLMFLSILGALIAGLVGSWLSYRWVWNDRWSLSRAACIVVAGLAATTCLLVQAPFEMTVWQAAKWLVTMPLAVLATQCMTVLVAMAAIRYDIHVADSASPIKLRAIAG
jgi:hypothetical protein